jgi:hypothetical protein
LFEGVGDMRRVISISFFFLLFSFTPARAEIIQIGLTGLVDSVTDPYNLLENGVHQNDPIAGFYIYDSATPDSKPQLLYYGEYVYSTTPFGISSVVGDLTFQTNPANVDFIIGVLNNEVASIDGYEVSSHNNLELGNGVIVDDMGWKLDDFYGTALSSDALPLMPLDLSQWQSNYFSIYGRGLMEDDKWVPFSIYGHVDSVYLIPEPATIILFSLGGLFLRKRM